MNYCPKCGNEILQRSNYCDVCGIKLLSREGYEAGYLAEEMDPDHQREFLAVGSALLRFRSKDRYELPRVYPPTFFGLFQHAYDFLSGDSRLDSVCWRWMILAASARAISWLFHPIILWPSWWFIPEFIFDSFLLAMFTVGFVGYAMGFWVKTFRKDDHWAPAPRNLLTGLSFIMWGAELILLYFIWTGAIDPSQVYPEIAAALLP